jgi:hydroxyacylglutathione hydrolase
MRPDSMVFRQFIHDDLGCASYLVGDDLAGVAAVVDPRLHIDEYLRLARYLHLRIEHVLETHTHADHVSGHGRLAAATGAAIHIHRLAAPDYEHEPFEDGWTLELGAVRVRAMHVPGHRPEHSAFLVMDSERGPEPWAVLTGDSLFVGAVICASGQRSAVAAGLVQRLGGGAVMHVAGGGVPAWRRAGYPIEGAPPTAGGAAVAP